MPLRALAMPSTVLVDPDRQISIQMKKKANKWKNEFPCTHIKSNTVLRPVQLPAPCHLLASHFSLQLS